MKHANRKQRSDASILFRDLANVAADVARRKRPSVASTQLRAALSARGSRKELAISLGVTSQYISGWLSGRQRPSRELQEKLNRRFGIQVASWAKPAKRRAPAFDRGAIRGGLRDIRMLVDQMESELAALTE